MPILTKVNQDNLKEFGKLNCTVKQCMLNNTYTDLRRCTAYAGSLISYICDKAVNKALSTLLIYMLQPLFSPVLTYKDQANVRLYFKPGSEYPYSDCVVTLLLYFTLPLYFKLYYMIYYITQHGMCSHNGLMADTSIDKTNRHMDISISMDVKQGLAVRLTPTFLL